MLDAAVTGANALLRRKPPNMRSTQLVQKLWNYCNILRDDGLSYGDYVEQLTFLLFLKMADEQSRPPFNRKSPIPQRYSWPELRKRDGDELEIHYRHTLEELGKEPGLIGVIFRKAQNKIQDPAKLRRLIADLIDKEEWSSLETDVKGDAYEGLLQKNAEDVKGGAGQYFTPRPLIRAIVDVCVRVRVKVRAGLAILFAIRRAAPAVSSSSRTSSSATTTSSIRNS
jgi:type I restriction enzyme M protein